MLPLSFQVALPNGERKSGSGDLIGRLQILANNFAELPPTGIPFEPVIEFDFVDEFIIRGGR